MNIFPYKVCTLVVSKCKYDYALNSQLVLPSPSFYHTTHTAARCATHKLLRILDVNQAYVCLYWQRFSKAIWNGEPHFCHGTKITVFQRPGNITHQEKRPWQGDFSTGTTIMRFSSFFTTPPRMWQVIHLECKSKPRQNQQDLMPKTTL